jgi:hypothetical protein
VTLAEEKAARQSSAKPGSENVDDDAPGFAPPTPTPTPSSTSAPTSGLAAVTALHLTPSSRAALVSALEVPRNQVTDLLAGIDVHFLGMLSSGLPSVLKFALLALETLGSLAHIFLGTDSIMKVCMLRS